MIVSSGDTSCTAVRSSPIPVSGTSFQFTPSSASQPAVQTQSGSSYAIFSSIVGGTYGTYTIVPTAPSGGYTLVRSCLSRTLNAPLSGEGLSATVSVPTDGETLVWEQGYTTGLPWVQTGGGGNVYGAGNLTSFVAELAAPRSFSLDSAGGYPGVVTYGTGYDLTWDWAKARRMFQAQTGS